MKEMTGSQNSNYVAWSNKTRSRFASSVVGHPDSWTQQKFEFCCVIKGRVCGGGEGSVATRLICELILHLPYGEVRKGQGCFFLKRLSL